MNEITLVVTEEDINILSVALGKLPYEHVLGLITKLQAQINEQQIVTE